MRPPSKIYPAAGCGRSRSWAHSRSQYSSGYMQRKVGHDLVNFAYVAQEVVTNTIKNRVLRTMSFP